MQNGQKWPIGLNFKVHKTYPKLFGSWLSGHLFQLKKTPHLHVNSPGITI